jgi:hypothetical protein
MKRIRTGNDNRTLAELAQALRSIARKRRSIANILNDMAFKYEARPARAAVRVSVAKHEPFTFRET